jgi:hypothetical protein
MERPIKAFDLSVAGWMVRSGSRFVNLVQAAELVDQGTLKAPTLVRVNAAWNAELEKPFGQQDLGSRHSTLVPGWDCHSVFTKHIGHH